MADWSGIANKPAQIRRMPYDGRIFDGGSRSWTGVYLGRGLFIGISAVTSYRRPSVRSLEPIFLSLNIGGEELCRGRKVAWSPGNK
jgi:hypothetical protein